MSDCVCVVCFVCVRLRVYSVLCVCVCVRLRVRVCARFDAQHKLSKGPERKGNKTRSRTILTPENERWRMKKVSLHTYLCALLALAHKLVHNVAHAHVQEIAAGLRSHRLGKHCLACGRTRVCVCMCMYVCVCVCVRVRVLILP